MKIVRTQTESIAIFNGLIAKAKLAPLTPAEILDYGLLGGESMELLECMAADYIHQTTL
jgi:hypothetical protein